MFYAMIALCLASVGMCDVEHAVWAIQSDPVFTSVDECVSLSVHRIWETLPTLNLEQNVQYMYNIVCEMVDARGL